MRIRRNPSPSSSSDRLRKKQKRLDAICEKEYNRNRGVSVSVSVEVESGESVRRSARVKRAPVLLDVSPSPVKKRRRVEKDDKDDRTKEEDGGGEESGSWKTRLRLRSSVKSCSLGFKEKIVCEDERLKLFDENEGVKVGRGRLKKKGGRERAREEGVELAESNVGKELEDAEEDEKEDLRAENIEIEGGKEEGEKSEGLHVEDGQSGSRDLDTNVNQCDELESDKEKEGGECRIPVELQNRENGSPVEFGRRHVEDNILVVDENFEVDKNVEVDKSRQFFTDMQHIRKGRRCGLCGRGTDEKPPKRLVTDPTDSDNEANGGSSSCEEGNYDVLDGFGDEPGWLGRLLGPIHDRFGIADVWVHQHCAVWSPEVYFAGLGCLKNVRAALSRGKALKCSRCGRPGASIGCRVDRCPKTYHLPCARAVGCIFNHRKFLIACNDHRILFEPHRNNNLQRLKKLKAKKLKFETRKLSHDAWKKDLEAEEKWLENCGEDEEFLKREGKRLQRDILRISPVYIGGSSAEHEKLFQGWESVAGLQNVIQCLKEVVMLPLLYPEFYTTIGLTAPRGVLLHGYPGTGKTHVVRALIGSCARGDKRIAYFARKGADCLGKYVGDAERQLRLLFQVAERSQPSIIFFDEIDGLAPCRTRQQDQTHNSVVSTLLALMDGLKSRGSVIVIGATNRPDSVDPALRRPGRFDREIYFPLPSVKDRAAILSLHTRSWPKPISGSLLKWISHKTSGFAGADLQALCTQAAMAALKRNFPLQELMSAAEKKSDNGTHLLLPSCPVEETDWLGALACAPPPCSRREAGMSANDVVSSPLPADLIPCLLQPLSYLLVSLYLDERVWLPPFLSKAAKLINSIVVSALEQREKSSDFWWSYLPNLVKEADVATQIERALSSGGFIVSGSSFSNFNALPDNYDADNEFEHCKVSSTGARASLLQNVSCSGRTTGFRVLITGHPKSGQKHIASCVLHGFVGHVEIQKVDLATISQEGHGDVVEGMNNILLKCSSKGVCIIYMPRIDLWAMETQLDDLEEDSRADICESMDTAGLYDAKKTVSQLWTLFMEQVDSVCVSASLMIVATSEVASEDLPHRISQFFTSNVLSLNDSTTLEHTMPRFIVQMDGSVDFDMVINSSAAQLSRDLIQQYVQLLHEKTHSSIKHKSKKVGVAVVENAELDSQNTFGGTAAEGNANVRTSTAIGSCLGKNTQEHIHGDDQLPTLLGTTDPKEAEAEVCRPQETIPRIHYNNKTTKGKTGMLLAISSFGYQILQYPHFAELCWTTSKLKEGPYADTNGPWKGWPFNSCVVRPDNSLDKVSLGRGSNNLKGKEIGVVRGLTAVGLLAYKGVYTSIKQVSFEVRKVLEILVEQLTAKILAGKDRSRFHHLLSQVAYLEDMVNCWAYTLQSLECDSSMSATSPGALLVSYPDDQHTSQLNAVGRDVSKTNNFQENHDELKVLEQSEYIGSNAGIACLNNPNSDARITTSNEPHQEIAAQPSDSALQTSTSAVDLLASGKALNTSNKVNNVEPENATFAELLHGNFGTSGKSNGFVMERSTLVSEDGADSHDELSGTSSSNKKVNNGFQGLSMEKMVLPFSDTACKSAGLSNNISITMKKDNNSLLSSASCLTCLYSCCFNCIDLVYDLIRKVLIREWKTIGNSWSVEDAHDATCSWSTNLLSAVRKLYAVESVRKSEIIGKNSPRGSNLRLCTCSDVDHRQSNGNLFVISSGNSGVAPVECCFHSRSKNVTENSNACPFSQFGLGLDFFFKDNVLIASDLDKDVLIHCKIQNLCLGSLIKVILMIKQPLN